MTINEINAKIRKAISHLGVKGKFSVAGSFLAFRIEDPDKLVTMYQATEVQFIVGNILRDLNLVERADSLCCIYHHGGVVMNWRHK